MVELLMQKRWFRANFCITSSNFTKYKIFEIIFFPMVTCNRNIILFINILFSFWTRSEQSTSCSWGRWRSWDRWEWSRGWLRFPPAAVEHFSGSRLGSRAQFCTFCLAKGTEPNIRYGCPLYLGAGKVDPGLTGAALNHGSTSIGFLAITGDLFLLTFV